MPIDTTVVTADGVRTGVDVRDAHRTPGNTWVHVESASAEEVATLEEVFGIHELATDDTMTNVRATIQEFTDHTFMLLKTARLAAGETTFSEELVDTPLGIFIGTDWLVTLSTGEVESVARLRTSITDRNARLLERGPDYVAYLIVDTIVDDYFSILDQVETQIEAVEDAVVSTLDIEILEGINNVRRELLAVRKLLFPAREAVGFIARGESAHISEKTEKYYRDVYDHLVHLVELAETYRELATGARDIYLNSLSVSTNEVMKKLTVVATIVLPLTFITGIYGMNFTGSPYNMPELTWQYGYATVLLLMAVTAFLQGAYFARKGWI